MKPRPSAVIPDATPSETWLRRALSPHFFDAMRDEPEALAILRRELDTLKVNEHVILADRPKAMILATRNTPGSLLQTLTLRNRRQPAISYAMFEHSSEAIPGLDQTLEIQRLEFDCKSDAEITAALARK